MKTSQTKRKIRYKKTDKHPDTLYKGIQGKGQGKARDMVPFIYRNGNIRWESARLA